MIGEILHNCRIEGAGADAYGRDDAAAILATIGFTENATRLSSPRSAALFDSDKAMFADLHDGHVTRLWLLSREPVGFTACERTDTPFDLDLDQRGGAVAFDPEDHPDLAPDDAERIRAAASDWLIAAGPERLQRLRPIVLRAFSHAGDAAALIAVLAKRGDAAGHVRFNVAIWLPKAGEAQTVIDHAGLAAETARCWSPRL